ncbi:hypothetical protein [Kamptonema formosum]|uniref:hypothetical protein n=1 Tax=Kamptonema formosum TaxID=331992 RepID=UPI00034DEDAD|nr:hypothetical protein [Oscillatoria sp. PCC 10802]
MICIDSLLRKSLAFLAFSAAIMAANQAAAEVKTAESGNVRADLSYQQQDYRFSNVRLRITRAGKTVSDQPVPVESEYDRPLAAMGGGGRNAGFQVQDLDGDKEPEVIVDFYTGGAHCCTYSLIYRSDSAKSPHTYLKHPWGNVGYTLRDLDRDGLPEFNSGDDRFAAQFTAYAGSRFPVQIWQYRQGKMSDVTRQYPQQIYSQAYQLWQDFQQAQKNGTDAEGLAVKGILAAYVADKYLLGQGEDGWQKVRQAYRLRNREQFFSDLQKFLKETGYIRNSR